MRKAATLALALLVSGASVSCTRVTQVGSPKLGGAPSDLGGLPNPIKSPSPEDPDEIAARCDQARQKLKEELLQETDAIRSTLERLYKALLKEQRDSLAALSQVLRDPNETSERKIQAKQGMITILEDTLRALGLSPKGSLYADIRTEKEGKLQRYLGTDFASGKLASVRRELLSAETLGKEADLKLQARRHWVDILKYNWLPGEERFEISAHILPLKDARPLLKEDGTPEQNFELDGSPSHQSLFAKIESAIEPSCRNRSFLRTEEQKREFGRVPVR